MNYNATTIDEAKEYLNIRYKELASLGIILKEEINYENKAIVSIYSNNYCSIYILNQFRGQQLFIKLLQIFMLPIITMNDCNITEYLDKIKCNYIVVENGSKAYQKIKKHYGNIVTKRSNIPLINHIDEGLVILNELNASQDAKDAYCLHPLLQSDEDFLNHYKDDYTGINTSAIILTMEYRRVANSYLSTGKMKNFVGFTSTDIYHMLYADKKQNEKDFALYHEGKHKRSKELREYFDNWLNILLK